MQNILHVVATPLENNPSPLSVHFPVGQQNKIQSDPTNSTPPKRLRRHTTREAAISKRSVLFICLLGFLVQSIVLVAGPFFESEVPSGKQSVFLLCVCVLLFAMKFLYDGGTGSDDDYYGDSTNLFEDPRAERIVPINRVAGLFLHLSFAALIISTTVMGSGLDLLTHSYLADDGGGSSSSSGENLTSSSSSSNARTLVCGGFALSVLAMCLLKSMRIRRIPVEHHRDVLGGGEGGGTSWCCSYANCLFLIAHAVQTMSTLLVVAMGIEMCLRQRDSGIDDGGDGGTSSSSHWHWNVALLLEARVASREDVPDEMAIVAVLGAMAVFLVFANSLEGMALRLLQRQGLRRVPDDNTSSRHATTRFIIAPLGWLFWRWCCCGFHYCCCCCCCCCSWCCPAQDATTSLSAAAVGNESASTTTATVTATSTLGIGRRKRYEEGFDDDGRLSSLSPLLGTSMDDIKLSSQDLTGYDSITDDLDV